MTRFTADHRSFLRRLTGLMRYRGNITSSRAKYFQGALRAVGNWGWRDNIVGVALGWKTAAQLPCITLFVKKRYHRERLSRRQYVPEGLRLPGGKAELLTDIVETGGYARLHLPTTAIVRSGEELGHEHGVLCPGSAGILLERVSGDPKGVYLLGCAHVMALSRRTTAAPAAGQFIEQPFDPAADPEANQIARLTTHFSPLTERKNQFDDFAIAKLLSGTTWTSRLKDSNRQLTSLSTKAGPNDFQLGEAYEHFGAVSGKKLGFVTHAEGSFTMPSFGHSVESDWIYQGLIPYTAIAKPGDSGGAVVEKDGNSLVGLHTGGFDDGSVSFFYPVGPILSKLGFHPVQNRQSPVP